MENLAGQPDASVPQASGDWANTLIDIQFWQYKKKRDFNFTHHRAKTEEQGFGMTCAQKYVRGLKVHSLMISTSQGVPLGILEQQIWTLCSQKNQAKESTDTKKRF